MLFPLKKKKNLKWPGENRSSQAVLRSQSIWLKIFKVLIFCCFMVFKYIFIFYFQFFKILSFNWIVGYVGSNSMTSGWACTPALEARSFKHWTTREVPCFYFILWENERIWLSYSNPQENWSRSIISGIENTKLPLLSSSKGMHLLWTTDVCVQSSLLWMLPYTDKKPGWTSGGHDLTCACHHMQGNYSGGAQFQHF